MDGRMEMKVIALDEMETKTIELPLDPVSWEKRQRERARRYAEWLRRKEKGDGFDYE